MKETFLKQLFFLLLSVSGANALFRWFHRGRLKVLLYHGVDDEEQFRKQLRHLKRHYNVLSMDQNGNFSSISKDRVNILITFDDGLYFDYTHAAPALRAASLSACFFLITECLKTGEPPVFARKYIANGENPERYRTFTVSQAAELANQGMTIGSHSLSHTDFSLLSDDQALADARKSRDELSSRLGLPVTAFAFPWGKHRESQLRALRSDFRRIFLTKHGFNDPDDAVLCRNEVVGTRHLYTAASGSLDFFR